MSVGLNVRDETIALVEMGRGLKRRERSMQCEETIGVRSRVREAAQPVALIP
jgi:hypothetical protein